MSQKPEFDLIVNKKEHRWANEMISGSEILGLAGSPTDWIVNQIVPGPGGDPQIAPNQQVPLDHQAEPKGIKRFLTRKPTTTPGGSWSSK